MADSKPPAPRLQLRWAPATQEERDDHPHLPVITEVHPRYRYWACHYELVLPLREGDIRRGRKGDPNGDVLIIPLGKTVCGGSREPGGPPYRDGNHAQWDRTLLGNLPVYHMASDGSFRVQDAPE